MLGKKERVLIAVALGCLIVGLLLLYKVAHAGRGCKCTHHTSSLGGGPWVDPAAVHVTQMSGDWVFGIEIKTRLGPGRYTVVLQPQRDKVIEHTNPGHIYIHETNGKSWADAPVTRVYSLHRVVVLGIEHR